MKNRLQLAWIEQDSGGFGDNGVRLYCAYNLSQERLAGREWVLVVIEFGGGEERIRWDFPKEFTPEETRAIRKEVEEKECYKALAKWANP